MGTARSLAVMNMEDSVLHGKQGQVWLMLPVLVWGLLALIGVPAWVCVLCTPLWRSEVIRGCASSPSTLLETGSLLFSAVLSRLPVLTPSGRSVPTFYLTVGGLGSQACTPTPSVFCFIEIRTQVLRLASQTQYPLSHLPAPCKVWDLQA